MNRIYQGRVTKVEIPGGKDAQGKQEWHRLGFTKEQLERLEKEQERQRLLAGNESLEGIDARKKLAELNRQLNEPWQNALWQHHQLFQIQ
jgi:hypothetical protein